MKQLLKFLSLALIVGTVALASCSKDDNPADNDLFVGTYSGTTSYTGVPSGNGKVTVVKVGNTYKFDFRDNGDIPSITDVTIAKGDEGYIGTANGYTGIIKFNANNLNIAVTKSGNNWTADCNR
ncbi:hypothetical protein [Niabella beijingensis]|uniref:hypothetical protein n=1 Tax=Niabella beijingensis TaxID=2872700 RepID=UPI001CC01F14|nr:hypothetical protein [Niabella beijingensis]MBZ4190653.1 hypothetical protein [Niabella beijingensis]